MAEEKTLEGLKGKLVSLREKHREVQEEIDELKEKEDELKSELERVREQIKYYEDLIADMKKDMEGRSEMSLFDHI